MVLFWLLKFISTISLRLEYIPLKAIFPENKFNFFCIIIACKVRKIETLNLLK